MFTLNTSAGRRSLSALLFVSGTLLSAAVWSAQGPLCTDLDKNTSEQAITAWLDAQEKVKGDTNGYGHTLSCHIGKDKTWLVNRTKGKMGVCDEQATASTWHDASTLWNATKTYITAVCNGTQAIASQPMSIPLSASEKVGMSFKRGSLDTIDINGNDKMTVVIKKVQNSNELYLLTSYPQK